MESLGFIYKEDEYNNFYTQFNNQMFSINFSLHQIDITKEKSILKIKTEPVSFLYILSLIERFIKDYDDIIDRVIKVDLSSRIHIGIEFDSFIKTIDDTIFLDIRVRGYEREIRPTFPNYYSLNHGFVTMQDQLTIANITNSKQL